MLIRRWTVWLKSVLVCICLILPGLSHADEWGPPKLEHWSDNRQYVLRLDPVKKTMKLLHKYPYGETVLWSVATDSKEHSLWIGSSPALLRDPRDGKLPIPAAAYIRNDGRFVVLRDQYAEIGYGKVLIFLGEHGQTLYAYRLADLFSQSEILDVQRSVSSIWWSDAGLFQFSTKGDRFEFLTNWGAVGQFDVTTGARLPENGPEADAFRQEARKIEQADLRGGDVSRGVMLAGLLKDRDSVPILKQMLLDTSRCRMYMNGRYDDYFVLQLEAGKALVQILGKDAAPLLEKRLSNANPTMASKWIELIEKTGAAVQCKVIVRYAQGGKWNLRQIAISALIDNGGIAIVRNHPEWLRDNDEDVRLDSTECLAAHGDNRDLPSLRRMLRSSDRNIRRCSLGGLIRLNPPDFRDILHRNLEEPEARVALAESGDQEQLRWCVNQLQQFAGFSQKTAIDQRYLQEIAKILVRRRPAGTQGVLRKIVKLPDSIYTPRTYFQSVGLGGLAALGDHKALQQERKIAATAEVFSAVQAIEWLGILHDQASIPFLRSALKNREVMIRDEARKALKTMGVPEEEPHVSERVPNLPLHRQPAGSQTSHIFSLCAGGLAVLLLCTMLLRIQRRRV